MAAMRRRRKETDGHRRRWSFGAREADRAMKSTRERAEEKRQEKLDHVREQVESGSLVIRKMTAEERRRFPPRAAQQSKRRDKR
jgi:hypothetical protein